MFPVRILACALICLPAPCCVAAEAQPAGFGPGFELLAGLGLPELPPATVWIDNNATSSGYNRSSDLIKGIKGNAWLLPPTKEGEIRTLALGSASITTTPAEDSGSKSVLGKMLGSGDKPEPAREIDLAKDIDTLCKNIGKIDDFDDLDDFRATWSNNGAGTFGPMMLFAAQIHQAGKPALANQLAEALFQKAPNREVVVDAAINSLGDQLYENATRRFFETHDWKTYHQELSSLVESLSRGWNSQAAVAMLFDPLAKRAAGEPPAIPQLDGIPIETRAVDAVAWMHEDPKPDADEAKLDPEIAAQLAGVPAQYRAQYLQQLGGGGGNSIHGVGTWLMETPEDLEKKAGPAAPTVKLGVHALPVLAALTGDTYLTARPNVGGGGSSHYFSSSTGPLERAIQIYGSMNRPASRGDLATYLLAATLPDPGNEISQLDPQSLADMAVEFWKEHRDEKPADIALAFLSNGSSEQMSTAAKVLAASKDPAHHQALEAHVLADLSPVSQLMTVSAYVQLRKTAAKPFFDRYLKTLREEIKDGDALQNNDELTWELRDKDRVNQTIKQLESQVSGKSSQSIAKEIAQGSAKDARTAVPALFESLSDAPLSRQLVTLLTGALAAEDPEIRKIFLNQSYQLDWHPEAGDGDEDDTVPADRKFTDSEAKAWKRLIADERETPDSDNSYYGSVADTLGKLAAVTFEYSILPNGFEDLNTAATITGRKLADIAFDRATARLDGKPVPPFPDATKITPARLAEIVNTAAGKPLLEIHPYLKSLSDDERAAWFTWIREPGGLAVPENVVSTPQRHHRTKPGLLRHEGHAGFAGPRSRL